MKILLSLVAVVILLQIANYVGKSPIVREIGKLELTEYFLDEIKIDEIAQKYIRLGSTKDQVTHLLKSLGFDIKEFDNAPQVLSCKQCDDAYISGGYIFYTLFIIPATVAEIRVGFENNKAILIIGTYRHSNFAL